LKPSARREIDITDLNNVYLSIGELHVQKMGRGFARLDTGTPDSLMEAGEVVRAIEKEIACAGPDIRFGF
jgi:glucose-1-phosphate thymidylyltransferase